MMRERWQLTDIKLPADQHSIGLRTMMTSSNGNIFCVTGPLCGEFTGPGEFPAQRPVTRSLDVFFDLRLNNRLSQQPWGWWFETPAWSLWRHRNAKLWLDGLGNRIKFTHNYYGSWNRFTGTTWFGQWSWICVRNAYVKASSRVYADTGISPFGRNCHHCLHWNLSQYCEFEWLFQCGRIKRTQCQWLHSNTKRQMIAIFKRMRQNFGTKYEAYMCNLRVFQNVFHNVLNGSKCLA